jgi:hypothetical protein
MTEDTDHIEVRLMNLEQCISKNNVEMSERLTKLEVKINILAYLGMTMLATSIGILTIYFHL